MSWRGFLRGGWRVLRSPLLVPFWKILLRKIRKEVAVTEPVADELRLVMARGILTVGRQAEMTLQSQFHQAVQGRGSIQYRHPQSGTYVSIELDDTFEGTSPFPYTSQQPSQILHITPGQVGSYFLRVQVTDDTTGQTYNTNEIRRKVLSAQGGTID
jgi:hypothetical protein